MLEDIDTVDHLYMLYDPSVLLNKERWFVYVFNGYLITPFPGKVLVRIKYIFNFYP